MVNYLYSLDNTQPMVTSIVTNAAVVEGDLLAITAGLVGPAAAATTTIIGIAGGSAKSGEAVPVLIINEKSVLRVPFKGSTKKTLVAADRFGTAFDWNATNKGIDLDDTTGGMMKVVKFKNVNASTGVGTADVVVDASNLWNA